MSRSAYSKNLKQFVIVDEKRDVERTGISCLSSVSSSYRKPRRQKSKMKQLKKKEKWKQKTEKIPKSETLKKIFQ